MNTNIPIHFDTNSPATSKFQIGNPQDTQKQELRSLWKEAFGDSDSFLDLFEATAFSSTRCRCVTLDDKVVAALYWFDCEFQSKPIAYIYAVATASSHRGQGLCHALMKDTHEHLLASGYMGAVLVPGSKELFQFYEDIGYRTCTYVEEIRYDESMLHTFTNPSTSLHPIDITEYAKLRRRYLPKYGILQEKENLAFLQPQAKFYAGEDFVLACQKQGDFLQGIELLGNTSVIPAILSTFHCHKGTFRTPGSQKPFGMFYSFTEHTSFPSYFGLAFD